MNDDAEPPKRTRKKVVRYSYDSNQVRAIGVRNQRPKKKRPSVEFTLPVPSIDLATPGGRAIQSSTPISNQREVHKNNATTPMTSARVAKKSPPKSALGGLLKKSKRQPRVVKMRQYKFSKKTPDPKTKRGNDCKLTVHCSLDQVRDEMLTNPDWSERKKANIMKPHIESWCGSETSSECYLCEYYEASKQHVTFSETPLVIFQKLMKSRMRWFLKW